MLEGSQLLVELNQLSEVRDLREELLNGDLVLREIVEAYIRVIGHRSRRDSYGIGARGTGDFERGIYEWRNLDTVKKGGYRNCRAIRSGVKTGTMSSLFVARACTVRMVSAIAISPIIRLIIVIGIIHMVTAVERIHPALSNTASVRGNAEIGVRL